jgi:hypothetical protein
MAKAQGAKGKRKMRSSLLGCMTSRQSKAGREGHANAAVEEATDRSLNFNWAEETADVAKLREP